MKIRKAKLTDEEELIKLIQLADERTEDVASKKVKKYIDSEKGFFLLAIEGKKIIGYLLFIVGDNDAEVEGIKVGDYSFVDWIAVHSDFRNKKIGSQLLVEAMKYSKKYNKKGLSLGCRDDALKFYEKNGFKNIKAHNKLTKSGKLKPCYIMKKNLK